MELKYFLNFMSVLVTRKANSPPKTMEITQVSEDRITVLSSGFQRFVLASLLVNRSM